MFALVGSLGSPEDLRELLPVLGTLVTQTARYRLRTAWSSLVSKLN